MVIEKILGEQEKLHAFSGVHGTTGYEWLNTITQVLIDGKGSNARRGVAASQQYAQLEQS